jgi:C1A family cysteine protease
MGTQLSILNNTHCELSDFYGTPTHRCLYNWRRDLPNKQDKYNLMDDHTECAPTRVDLRKSLSAVYSQRALGTSTIQALRLLMEHRYQIGQLSAMFLYYVARDEEGTVLCDSGVGFRTAINAANKYGVCSQLHCPYDPRSYRERPSEEAYQLTIPVKLCAERVPHELCALKYHLSRGVPVAFGMTVYSSFESCAVQRTGQIPMPETDAEDHLGGHAMVLVGYDDHDDHFIVRNSWGVNWGDSGYGYVPYAFVADPELCCDFWILGEGTTYDVDSSHDSSSDEDEDAEEDSAEEDSEEDDDE